MITAEGQSFGGSLVQPIFAGGRIRSGVKFSEAQQPEMVLTYRQTIQQAWTRLLSITTVAMGNGTRCRGVDID